MRKLFFLFENNSTGSTCNFQKTLSEVKPFVFFPFTLALHAPGSDLFKCSNFKFCHFLVDVCNIKDGSKVGIQYIVYGKQYTVYLLLAHPV